MNGIIESIGHTLKIESDSIAQIGQTLDVTAVESIVEMLCGCRGKVFVTGCGTSGAAAKKIAHTLCCVNRPAAFLSPADAVHGGLGVVDEGDIAILISKGGATPEITNLVGACKAKGAKTVAVTEKSDSKLARECDVLLKIVVEKEPDAFNMLATASTLTVIAVMDAIAICVMERSGFTKEAFGVIHPGGAVGEKLLGKK